MNVVSTSRRHSLLLSVLVAAAAAACLTGGPDLLGPSTRSATASETFRPLVRWRDSTHNWLLVADGVNDRVLVYDAGNGRPLHRLGSADGITRVASLFRHGNQVWLVHDDGATDQLQLPQLRLLARSSH